MTTDATHVGLVADLIRLPVQPAVPEANLTADDVVGVAARERYKLNNFRVAIEDAVVPRLLATLVGHLVGPREKVYQWRSRMIDAKGFAN